MSIDMNRSLLEADEFVTKYDLDDSRNIIRRGVLLFYHPDDYARIEEEEVIYLRDSDDTHVESPHILRTAICYAAGFLSLTVSEPLPEWTWISALPTPVGIARPLHRYTMGQTRMNILS